MEFYLDTIESQVVNIKTDWKDILKKSSLQTISESVNSENSYPSKDKIFRAFNYFDIKDTKVVIIGQDCYHRVNQANGLCFSVNNGISIPPSLRNILREMNNDLNINRKNTDFSDLAHQGILFLNCALTVESGKPRSHLKLWEPYTDFIINYISENCSNVIFVLWGGYAKRKKKFINIDKHFILESNHPSPLSANRGGFFNTKPFSKINEILKNNNSIEINWNPQP